MGNEKKGNLHYSVHHWPSIAGVELDVVMDGDTCKVTVDDMRELDYERLEGDVDVEKAVRCLFGPLSKLPWHDGAYEIPDVVIMDGTEWSLSVDFGGRKLDCNGHECYPEGFDDVTDGLVDVAKALATGRDPFADEEALSAWERICASVVDGS